MMALVETTGTVHELKVWPDYFEAIVDMRKPFDVRRDDRGYKVGDVLFLREWKPDNAYLATIHAGDGDYTGRTERVYVTYVYRGQGNDPVELPPGVVVLGFAFDVEPSDEEDAE